MTLYWSSNQFKEEIIPQEYLYIENVFPPLKVDNFKHNLMVLGKLDVYSLAFKNSRNYFWADIPRELRGLPSLKVVTRFPYKVLSFSINAPVYVYIGVFTHYPNPLPDIFDNMQELMQIIDVKDGAPISKKVMLKI